MSSRIQAVRVWPGWLRLIHGLMALCVLFLLFSAWALQVDETRQALWRDWHLIVGQFLMLVLGARAMLWFSPGVGHWRSLVDLRGQWPAMRQTLLCYLSLGRLPLPNWYAHNPLWKPLYALFWLVLGLMVVTGMLHDQYRLWPGFSPASVHEVLAGIVTGFVAAHLLTAVLHDGKSEGGLISAMINGVRYFHIPAEKPAAPEKTVVEIPLILEPGGNNEP